MRRTRWLGVLLACGVACGDDATAGGTDSETDSGSSDPTTMTSTTDPPTATMMSDSVSATGTTGSGSGSTGFDSSSTGVDSTVGETSSGSAGSSGDTGGTSSSGTGGGVVPDLSGDYLVAAALVLAPELPLQWTAVADFTADAGGGGTLDLEFQPLALDVNSTTDPRTPFGAVLVYNDIPVNPDSTFTVDLGVIDIAPETNPITGGAVTVNLVFDGMILDVDNACGDLTGDITSPLMLDVAGSTVGITRIDDTDPTELPVVFPTACP